MSVLPESASFASFFILFAILLLFTIFLGLNLSALLAKIGPLIRKPKLPSIAIGERFDSFKLPSWIIFLCIKAHDFIEWILELAISYGVWEYFGGLEEIPEAIWAWPLFLVVQTILLIIVFLPVLVVRYCAIPEILYPKYQWYLFQYRGNPYLRIKHYKVLIITDIVRFSLIPAWIALVVVITLYLSLLELIFFGFERTLYLIIRYVLRY